MSLHTLIVSLKILVWISVVFKNVNKEHFYFFLVLAVIDPTFFISRSVISFSSNIMYVPAGYLLFLTLKPQKIVALVAGGIILSILYFQFTHLTINTSIMIIHFFIAGHFVKLAIKELNELKQISMFYPMLFLFETMTIVKAWVYTFDPVNGLTHFFFFNLLQIFAGLFFIFYNREKPRRFVFEWMN